MRSPHLHGLDGLRSICALVILWGHIPQLDFCDWGEHSLWSIRLPACCAYVFFVLSGFLAGYKDSAGLSFLAYYKRRAKRILPVYYGYILASIIAFCWLGKSAEIVNPKLLYYLFLLPGIPFSLGKGIIPLVHLWFVGTIVLFYLTFPLFAKVREEYKPKAAAMIAVCWFLLKLILYIAIGKNSFVYRFISVTSFDCLFLGVMLGLLWKQQRRTVLQIGNNRFAALLAWCLFLTSGFYSHIIPAPMRIEYIAGISGLVLLNLVSKRPVLSLDNKVFSWLGSISYEFYVVQILVIILLSMLYNYAEWNWPVVVIYLVCTASVMVIAGTTRQVSRLAIARRENGHY